MDQIQSHRDLVVWQKAMDLAVEVYRLSAMFPKAEIYRLVSQITRAAISVPANVAEGRRKATLEELLGEAKQQVEALRSELEADPAGQRTGSVQRGNVSLRSEKSGSAPRGSKFLKLKRLKKLPTRTRPALRRRMPTRAR